MVSHWQFGDSSEFPDRDPLALRLLAGDFKPGQTIVIDLGPDGLVFSESLREAAVAISA